MQVLTNVPIIVIFKASLFPNIDHKPDIKLPLTIKQYSTPYAYLYNSESLNEFQYLYSYPSKLIQIPL